MDIPEMRNNRVTMIGEISKALTASSDEYDCALLGLVQLNRNLEQRTDKRPIMSDMRDSGQLEQDASLIIFVYRDDMYNKDSPHANTAELIIGKARNTECDTIRLVNNLQYCRFDDYSASEYNDP
jgi:replicative DNA helicase